MPICQCPLALPATPRARRVVRIVSAADAFPRFATACACVPSPAISELLGRCGRLGSLRILGQGCLVTFNPCVVGTGARTVTPAGSRHPLAHVSFHASMPRRFNLPTSIRRPHINPIVYRTESAQSYRESWRSMRLGIGPPDFSSYLIYTCAPLHSYSKGERAPHRPRVHCINVMK